MSHQTHTCSNKKPLRMVACLGLILTFLALTSLDRADPEETTNRVFDIYLGSKHVGFLRCSVTTNSGETLIQADSEIEMRFLFRYAVEGKETYRYRNDTLLSSRLYRKINSKVDLDHSIIKNGHGYRMLGPDLERTLDARGVRINLIRLFLEEPIGAVRVFSDRFGQWVPVERTGPHQYKISFPNGSSSTFSYENGRCHSVVNSGSFYTVHLRPRSDGPFPGHGNE